jgi:CheY-like chemotaxis protein
MSEYLIAGALLALVALLWFVRARQRRSAQQDQGAESTLAAPNRFRAWRASSRLDSIQPALAPDSDPEAVALRAQREAAEEAARIEGDREAAEWEARLAAEQLAERAEEQDRVAAESQLEALTQQASAATAQAAAERSEREALESLERAYADSQHERQADDGAAQAPATPPASLPRPELTLEPAPAPAPKPGVVMVADASKVVRIKTSRLLEQHGWQTTLATDGLLALEHIRRADLHALITGAELSGLDGLALTRELRADPRTARLPIVMISADDASLREAARQAGVSLLLGKPYPADELIDFLASTRETAAEA